MLMKMCDVDSEATSTSLLMVRSGARIAGTACHLAAVRGASRTMEAAAQSFETPAARAPQDEAEFVARFAPLSPHCAKSG